MAEDSIVLLKNENNALPLDTKKPQKILVIGNERRGDDIFNPIIGAPGRGEVIPTSVSAHVNILAGLLNVEPFK